MGLFDALLRRRRLVVATTVLLALTGIGSWFQMPREEDPQFPHRDGLVVTAFPGADALTVERLVVEPIEERLAEVEAVRQVTSTARAGVAIQHVEFHEDVYATSDAWDEVEDALDEAQEDFPLGVHAPDLDDDLISQDAVVYALLGASDPLVLLDAAERLKRALVSIDQVKRVDIFADPGEQITIEYDDATARRLGVDAQSLGLQLAQRSLIVPGGVVHLGQKTAILRPQTEFRSLDEIRSTPILLPSGSSVPLGELARVRRGPAEPPRELMRWNGEPAVGVALVPQDGLDRVRLGEVVRERVAELVPSLAPVQIEEVVFQPDLVDERLSELTGSLRLGILIVALVLFLAMGPRLGIVVASVVPLVAFASIAVFALGGGILHQISIAALVIALGMLVDNAIVVAENIQYRLDEGTPIHVAAVESVKELALPLGTATGTTLAAFFPMLAAQGNTADFTRSIPVMIMLTLSVSYLFAVLVTPVLSELLLRPRTGTVGAVLRARRVARREAEAEAEALETERLDVAIPDAESADATRSEDDPETEASANHDLESDAESEAEEVEATREPSAAERLAAVVSRLAVQRPGWVLVGIVVLLAVTLFATRWVDLKFFPIADRHTVVVELEMPEGTHLESTDDVARRLERALLELDTVETVGTFVGRNGPKFYYNLTSKPASPHRSMLVAETVDMPSVDTVIAWVRTWVATELPSASVVARRLEQGPAIEAPVELRVMGWELADLEVVADMLLAELRTIEGTRDVRHDLSLGVPTVRFEIDDAEAARHGLDRADVARSLLGRTLGTEIGQYRVGEDPVPILVRSAEGEDLPVAELETIDVATPGSDLVPLTQLATLEVEWLPAAIYHQDRTRVVTVQAQVVDTTAHAVLDALLPTLDSMQLPEGVRVELGGELEESGKANAAIARQLPLGVLLLLFFLLLEFNSFRRVGIILVTVPLAAVGVVPGLILSGNPFGFMSLLGIISLVGIVVNNAIVLLDVIETRREGGASIDEALDEAIRRRLRPILLTMVTTVAGLSPLAFSDANLWPPLAWAMISGLIASTALTLLVIPALYKILFQRPSWRQLGFGRRSALASAALVALTLGGLFVADRAGAETVPEPSVLRLTLEDVMARAASRPAAEASEARARAADATARATRHEVRRARVTTSLEGVWRDDTLELETPIGPFELGDEMSWTGSLTLSQPVLDPSGMLYAAPAAARRADASSATSQRTRRELQATAASLFLDMLAFDASLASTEAFIESLDARLAEARGQVEAGRTLEADALKVELELESARLERTELVARRDVVARTLGRAVGVDGPVEPAPSAAIDRAQAVEVDTEAAAMLRLIEEARAARSDRVALLARLEAGELEARAVGAERLPRVDARATYFVSDGDPLAPESQLQAAVGVRWTPFDGGARGARRAAREAEVEALRADLVELERAIELAVRDAVAELRVARAAQAVRARGVVLATETLRVERERHAAGRSTTNDLLDAEASLRRQRTLHDVARLEVLRALVSLDLALGRLG
ncbi:MAG: efflux RND transporter permease subunit [Acidobacteriota bacterium]